MSSRRASATFKISAWEEEPYEEFDDGRKLTRARATKTFTEDIEGEGSLQYLMSYAEDGTVTFVGMERISGRLGERSGTFVLQHQGIFEGGVAQASLTVVPGSAGGELAGLRGEGQFASGHAEEYTFTLDYHFH